MGAIFNGHGELSGVRSPARSMKNMLSSRASVFERMSRKCLRLGKVRAFARFDSSPAKGDNCVIGDAARRTRSNPVALDLYGHLVDGFGHFYGLVRGVVVVRDKHAAESSGSGRAGCRTPRSLCDGIVGQTRTRILIR